MILVGIQRLEIGSGKSLVFFPGGVIGRQLSEEIADGLGLGAPIRLRSQQQVAFRLHASNHRRVAMDLKGIF